MLKCVLNAKTSSQTEYEVQRGLFIFYTIKVIIYVVNEKIVRRV